MQRSELPIHRACREEIFAREIGANRFHELVRRGKISAGIFLADAQA